MSGGYFDYKQHEIGEIADKLEGWLAEHYTLDHPQDEEICNLSDDTIDKFRETVKALRRAEVMVQRIDWLLSGDDDETAFRRRLEKDLAEVEARFPVAPER